MCALLVRYSMYMFSLARKWCAADVAAACRGFK